MKENKVNHYIGFINTKCFWYWRNMLTFLKGIVRFVILLCTSENITDSFTAVSPHSIILKDKIFEIIIMKICS